MHLITPKLGKTASYEYSVHPLKEGATPIGREVEGINIPELHTLSSFLSRHIGTFLKEGEIVGYQQVSPKRHSAAFRNGFAIEASEDEGVQLRDGDFLSFGCKADEPLAFVYVNLSGKRIRASTIRKQFEAAQRGKSPF